ncbi:MAG: AtpZ/AtpI family protein [Candidatus Omnitrophota bacterium]|nr:AtpZ/AtpI family protein [Candidatus Omnitrophota bacterium]
MNNSFFHYLGLVIQLGLVIIVAMAVGLSIGVFLDSKLGSGFLFTVVFSIFGVAGGFKAAYQLIREKDNEAGKGLRK